MAHLPRGALRRDVLWVSDISLLACTSWLTSLGVLFAASEFLTFPFSSAPHGSPPLACSLQQVSF
ncbi:hypothetical protein M378DRAFT_162618 [Amanita muscaria Koide BX008]|uniref:Uncharacterized protein n=1 Tax=Amanita muscaria (strain Koide BX008) TaxID=946122 RepID=A0A0C2X8H8_AMAMK|nr:hypothetical protein M378DRAFT_162618 [Amanita muscaria Koide BX008]